MSYTCKGIRLRCLFLRLGKAKNELKLSGGFCTLAGLKHTRSEKFSVRGTLRIFYPIYKWGHRSRKASVPKLEVKSFLGSHHFPLNLFSVYLSLFFKLEILNLFETTQVWDSLGKDLVGLHVLVGDTPTITKWKSFRKTEFNRGDLEFHACFCFVYQGVSLFLGHFPMKRVENKLWYDSVMVVSVDFNFYQQANYIFSCSSNPNHPVPKVKCHLFASCLCALKEKLETMKFQADRCTGSRILGHWHLDLQVFREIFKIIVSQIISLTFWKHDDLKSIP